MMREAKHCDSWPRGRGEPMQVNAPSVPRTRRRNGSECGRSHVAAASAEASPTRHRRNCARATSGHQPSGWASLPAPSVARSSRRPGVSAVSGGVGGIVRGGKRGAHHTPSRSCPLFAASVHGPFVSSLCDISRAAASASRRLKIFPLRFITPYGVMSIWTH